MKTAVYFLVYVFLCLKCNVYSQDIADQDVIKLQINAYIDFTDNKIYFRSFSGDQQLLLEFPGCSLDLDGNINDDMSCIYLNKINQSSWLRVIGNNKPKKSQGINITNFERTEKIIKNNKSIKLRLFSYVIKNNAIDGPKIIKDAIVVRMLQKGDLDDATFHMIPLQ
jgi:hypothetical protein